jgi:hypothetical protein
MRSESPSKQYPDGRLYRIQPNEVYGFVVGIVGENQVLVKKIGNRFLVLSFSRDGQFVSQRLIDADAPSDLKDALSRLLVRLGYRACTIQVLRFWFPEYSVGIQDLPNYLEAYVADPENCLKFLQGQARQEEAEDLDQDIKKWLDLGNFAFIHDGEYWMDEDGFCFAT